MIFWGFWDEAWLGWLWVISLVTWMVFKIMRGLQNIIVQKVASSWDLFVVACFLQYKSSKSAAALAVSLCTRTSGSCTWYRFFHLLQASVKRKSFSATSHRSQIPKFSEVLDSEYQYYLSIQAGIWYILHELVISRAKVCQSLPKSFNGHCDGSMNAYGCFM